ncbi:hypothetical protein [Pelagicoccus sp. SDUM812005]|uniref:hypothetical protein n=1 Tax=Pelagicoccus sp. SDUM812005 TaxID=3041257 RepID=UPI00281026F2|nr:hypothetical protein [Pelagicoccus sp. SDUM812005]MDQ8180727.1 hypothetical protein [Pelagicoccus sp. SDUM812005]
MLARINIKLRLSLAVLVFLLQRAPNLPAGLLSRLSLPSIQIVQKAFIAAASLAAPHAVSGATTSKYNVNDASYTVANKSILHIEPAQVGLKTKIDISNTITAASWTIEGEMPPGLVATDIFDEVQLVDGVINTPFPVIKGTPTAPGPYGLILKPWSLKDGQGNTAPQLLGLAFDIAPEDPAPSTPPRLGYQRQADTITLYWTTDEAASYQLTRSTDLALWDPVTLTPVQNGDQSSIQIPLTQFEFYRFAPAP